MRFLILFLIGFFSNFAYTPGKWSVFDKYSLGSEKNGPTAETVKNKSDQVLYSATYEYDSNGKLSSEKYTNSKGEPDGNTKYTYENNKLIKEELFSAAGDLVESKNFYYNLKDTLKEVKINLVSSGKTIRYRIFSMNKDFTNECETRWEDENTVESFSTKKDILEENVWIQEVFDERKKQIGEIKFFYDKDKRLLKRENSQASQKRLQTFAYGENGKLISFAFHVKQDENWLLIKTHYLSYNAKN